MVLEERTARTALRMSETEAAMLDALSTADGLSASDVIRQLIRKAYTERFGEKKPRPKK